MCKNMYAEVTGLMYLLQLSNINTYILPGSTSDG